ncbi:MAG TPA: hypothetical protein VIP46_07730 [Pyrinomonadaceae bacterium]
MRTLIVALALIFAAPRAPAQTGAAAGLRVRGRGRLIVLAERGRSHRLNLGDQISAARLEDVELLFAARGGSSVYLVVAACGPSKLRPDARQCGAGVECDLVWIKLDAGRRVADSKAVRYESCWAPVTSADGYKIGGGKLELEIDDFRENVSRRVTYDAGQPEMGFQIAERPLEGVP